jgi:hypothetical protein
MNKEEEKKLLATVYGLFNDRKLSTILEAMHPNVVWPNGMEGGYVYGRKGIRDYWTRQWSMINPHVDPVNMVDEPDGKIRVRVHQCVKDLNDNVLVDQLVDHLYSFKDELVIGMEIQDVS